MVTSPSCSWEGYRPVLVIPVLRDKERELKTEDELDTNLSFQLEQVKKFLDFDGPNAAIVVNNYDFTKT